MGGWARDTLWRQGHVLPDGAAATLRLCTAETAAACLAIVISHDCDLANDPDQEPFVEVIVGCRVAKADGSCTHAKNARKLHVAFRQGQASIVGEFLATGKVLVQKSDLAEFQPRDDLCLAVRQREILQHWLAARYRRAAFPDEFEERLRVASLKDRLARILKPHGALIRAIYFDVDGGEETTREGPDDVYVLDVFVLHTTDDSDKAFEAASKVKGEIEKAFATKLYTQSKGWQFIELRDCIVVSDEALTVKQSSVLKQWRLEHMSLREDPAQPMVDQ